MRSLLPVGLSACGLRVCTAVTFSATCGILLLVCLLYAPALRAQDYSITTAGGNLVVTDNSGNGETLAMSQSGGNIRLVVTPTTRTYSINGGPPTAFTTPADVALAGIASITINTAAGNDTINIAAFTANLPNLTINGGTGNDAVNFNGDITFAANASLDVDLQNDDAMPGEDRVTIAANANLILSGTGTATVKVSRNVTVNSGASLETENGNLTVEANQQMTATSGNFVGVNVQDGAVVRASGSGAVTVLGRGASGSSGGANYGVRVNGVGSQITSNGGPVRVEGTGGGSNSGGGGNIGVYVDFGGAITNTGTGSGATVTVKGFGGNIGGGGNVGVRVNGNNGSQISSSGGAVLVEGTGRGTEGGGNHGVFVDFGAAITSTGTGSGATVTVKGFGANTSPFGSYGVHVNGTGSQITSNGGAVLVEGAGGGTNGGGHYGVYVNFGGAIASTGTGPDATVTVKGFGGNTTSGGGANHGVYVSSNGARITSNGGAVRVEGTGGGAGTSAFNYGVCVEFNSEIASTGTGPGATVTVEGTGGNTMGISNYGVYVNGIGSQITSNGGPVRVEGIGGGAGDGGGNSGVYVNSGGVITSTGTGSDATVTVKGFGSSMSLGNANHGVYVSSNGARITSNGGAVRVEGTGGGAGTSTFNYGVCVEFNSEIASTGTGPGATVTVEGTGGNTMGISNYGVYVNGIGSQITSNGGPVRVEGTGGGAGDGGGNSGVYVNSGGVITSAGTGSGATVTVKGFGGNPSGTAVGNFGVHVVGSNARVTSSGGAVLVEGTGNSNSEALRLQTSGAITSGNNANITVLADGINIITPGFITSGTGTTTIRPRTAGTLINLGGADVLSGSPLTLGLTSDELNQITAGTLIIGRNDIATGSVTVSSAIAPANATALQIITARDIVANANLTGGAGGLTLSANQQATPTSGSFVGVRVNGATITTTGDGPVSVAGTGGTGNDNYGILIATGGQITSGGLGKVSVSGTGGSGPGIFNYGLIIDGADSQITSGGGSVEVSGQGGGGSGSGSQNHGIRLVNSGRITSGGNGTVTVNGTGGTGTGNDISGIVIAAAGQITSGGPGAVSVSGAGGSGPGFFNYGLIIEGADSRITSGGGDVEVTGQGGGGSGSGTVNHGIRLVNEGRITAGGNGTVTVSGTGGTGMGSDNYGVEVRGANTQITSSGGAVLVTGTGGGTATPFNYGVLVVDGGVITNAGTGVAATVTVVGQGGNTSGTVGGNYGIYLDGLNTQITSSGGAVSVTGIGNQNSEAIRIQSNAGITSGSNANITVVANGINLIAPGLINSGTGSTTIRPRTTGTRINLGGADVLSGSPLTLGLTDAELDQITTGTLILGDANSGNLTVSAAISCPAATNVQLRSGGDITFNQNFNTNGGTLLLAPGNSPAAVKPVFNGTDATASAVSFASDLAIVINGTTPGDGSGTTYTQLTVAGDVNLTGVDLVLSGSHTPVPGQTFTLVDNLGANAITGTFTGLPEGAVITLAPFNTRWARISYVGGTGNDVVLTVLASDYSIAVGGGNLVVTDNSGNGDVLSMSPSGANAVFNTSPARTYSLNGGATMNFPIAINNIAAFGSITINQAGGDDQFDIGAFSGLQNLAINGGTGNDAVNFNGDITFAANASLDVDLQNDDAMPGEDRVNIATNANLILSGTGTATVRVSRNVTLNSGGSLETENGNLTVEANQQMTATSGNFLGVSVFGGALQVNGSGALTVKGRGGDAGSSQRGIQVSDDGKIQGGSNTVTVEGRGGAAGGNNNLGIWVYGANSRITSSGGAVQVKGTGGGSGSSSFNDGVQVGVGGVITAGGNGTVFVEGIGGAFAGNNNYGVYVLGADARIHSSGGAVQVKGTGGGSGMSRFNYGVFVESPGEITAGGNGAVIVEGLGGSSGGNGNGGVLVIGTNARITSSGGPVQVKGTSGGSGSSSFNRGVTLDLRGQITAGGSGEVTVEGVGSASGGDENLGVLVITNARITSSGGPVQVKGIGGGSGLSDDNVGVVLGRGGEITAGGSGTVTVEGLGGASGGNRNYGVYLVGGEGNARITSSGGSVEVRATGNSGANPAEALRLEGSDSAITSGNNANITVLADGISLIAPGLINSGTGTTTIRPGTAGTLINLGGSDVLSGSPLTLGLTDAELDRVTAGTLILGDAASGNLTISAAISRPAATNVTLRSGGDVTFNQNFNTNGGTLLLDPGNSPAAVKPVFNGTDATASAVSFARDLAIVINGTTPGNGSGATYTQLTVSGDVNLTGVDLVLSGTHVPEVGQTFILVDNLGANPVTGTFNGLPEGALIPGFLGSNLIASITYLGGTGNDVVLEVVCPASTRLYVNDDAAGANNGSSWADAFTSLQAALSLAGQCNNITEIWVAEGTYKPSQSGDPAVSFVMKNNLSILGGFPNSGNPGIGDRDWTSHISLLSGDLNGDDEPGFVNRSDNSDHVVGNLYNGVDNTAILDGFTISGGYVEGTQNESVGGGMANLSASPTVRNCIFTDNFATWGGGMGNSYSSTTKVYNCRFMGNMASNFGGGMYNSYTAPVTVVNCTFSGNSASLGGGMSNVSDVQAHIINCSFSGNQAGLAGGICNAGTGEHYPVITNSIIWGNGEALINFGVEPTVNNSIVEGGYAPCTDCPNGDGNADPLFVNQPPIGLGTGGNLRLQACSPAIDAGNDAANSTTTDVDNHPRKFEAIVGGSLVDMGAYEYQQPAPVPTALCKNINAMLNPAGSVIVVASDIDDGSGDDTCGPVTLHINGQSSQTYSCSDLGPNTATLSVYATQSNRTATCTATVTVQDNLPPTITCPNPVTVTCASQIPAVNLNAVSASDNCGAPTKTLLGAVTSDSTCVNRKTVTRTYRATDGSGNSSTCTQVITVLDNAQPNFTSVPANVTVQCNSVPAVGTPTATDGCGGSVSITYNGQTIVAGACTDAYTITRQWTATDLCGNTRTATQRINVIDSQKPAFVSTPANITVQCDAIPAPTAPTATDNCDTDVAITYIGETRTNGTCLNRYTLTRRWAAADNCGNTVSISQRITVVDNNAPTLTIPANAAIACNDPVPPVGTATATDGCAGAVTVTYLGQTTANNSCPGTYQIRRTWRATDVCGNSTVATQTIQVSDNGAPVFTFVPGPITIECNTPLPPLQNPTASDACGGFVQITFLGNVPTGSGCAEDYTVTRTWRAQDLCGNTATASQVITVQGNNYNQEGAEDRAEADHSKLKTQNSKLVTVNPNPTTDRIWLDLTDFAGEAVTVSIFGELGQLIWENRIPAVEDLKLQVSLREAGAAAGMYTVSVRSAGGVVAKRVVLVE